MPRDSQVTLKTVFRFRSSRVTVMGEIALAVSVILSGAQQGSKGIRLICGKASLFLIFRNNVQPSESLKVLERRKL